MFGRYFDAEFRWIFLGLCFLCHLKDVCGIKYTVGVIGQDWYSIFRRKLIDRKEDHLVTLKMLEPSNKTVFYDNFMSDFDLIKNENINVLVGRAALAMAQSAADQSIPYFATDTNLHPTVALEYSNMPDFYMMPVTDDVYSRAIIDIITHFGVTKVAVLIDSSVNYQHFVRPMFDQKNLTTFMWTLNDEDTADAGKLREKIDKILEDSREYGCWDFVVKAQLDVVKLVISRAKHYGMLVRPNRWYLPSFVCVDINIPAIIQIYSNITMINEQCSESYLSQSANYTMEAIINKVIQYFRQVHWRLDVNVFRKSLKVGALRRFNEIGVQEQIKLTLHTLNFEEEQPGHLLFVGIWAYNRGNSDLSYFHKKKKTHFIATRTHLRVAAVEEHPHLIRQENGSVKGFGVDMITELSALMNATFTITVLDTMGIKEGSNWTGVVRELIDDRADLTLGPLVQSIEAEQVIDFSSSFKQREISLVMTGPSPSMSLFQFIQPFSWSVWLSCLVATVFVTFLTWGLERVHDIFFENKLDVKLNLKESSWFAPGSVLKKQLDVFPNSAPALINNASIFFFSLIIVTMYTANLAAFLTVQAFSSTIQEVEDLARLPPNSNISFGTVINSPILEFFRESDLDVFKQIYNEMAVKNPHWLVNSTAAGYRRALREPYVFIWDDSVNQYEIFTEPDHDCKLITVGRPFGKRSFAIGLQQGSQLKEKIDRNLLYLVETGRIESLLQKWWKSGSICSEKDSPNIDISPLSLSNVAGVFLIVVVGILMAVVWFSAQIVIFHIKENKARRRRQVPEIMVTENHESLLPPTTNTANGLKT